VRCKASAAEPAGRKEGERRAGFLAGRKEAGFLAGRKEPRLERRRAGPRLAFTTSLRLGSPKEGPKPRQRRLEREGVGVVQPRRKRRRCFREVYNAHRAKRSSFLPSAEPGDAFHLEPDRPDVPAVAPRLDVIIVFCCVSPQWERGDGRCHYGGVKWLGGVKRGRPGGEGI
jgi:hypothetical protein